MVPVRGAIKRGSIDGNLMIQALIKWKRIGDLWAFISDWFSRRSSSEKKSGIRFHLEEDELGLEAICSYISIAMLYPRALESLVCKDVFEQLGAFHDNYLAALLSGQALPAIYSEITATQWATLLTMTAKMNRALSRESGDVLKQYSLDQLRDVLCNVELDPEQERVVVNLLTQWMSNVVAQLKHPIAALADTFDVEIAINDICDRKPILIFSSLVKILDFLMVLMKYRFYRAKMSNADFDSPNQIAYQYELIAETILQKVLFKNEKRFSQDVGKGLHFPLSYHFSLLLTC